MIRSILLAFAVAATLFAAPASATASVQPERIATTQRACVEIAHYRRVDLCLEHSVNLRRDGRLVQLSARHWTPDCDRLQSPQAHIYWYSVSGIRANGSVVYGSRYIRQNFPLSGCSNTDPVDHVFGTPCIEVKIIGKARLPRAPDDHYRITMRYGDC